jgi:hypothetical protein
MQVFISEVYLSLDCTWPIFHQQDEEIKAYAMLLTLQKENAGFMGHILVMVYGQTQ